MTSNLTWITLCRRGANEGRLFCFILFTESNNLERYPPGQPRRYRCFSYRVDIFDGATALWASEGHSLGPGFYS